MGSQTSRAEEESSSKQEEENTKASERAEEVKEDDEPDEWDKRIYSTGCAEENAKMTDCYYEKKDWRACAEEMEQFRRCWKIHGNEERTASMDA